jgi:hypothetical protein
LKYTIANAEEQRDGDLADGDDQCRDQAVEHHVPNGAVELPRRASTPRR